MVHLFRRPLRAALVAAGLAALSFTAGCGGGEDGRPRVLVVGWDGATFDLLDPLLAAGRLPHLAGLVAAGRTAVMESTAVPISSAAWTTAVTGKEPGETGVYSFFQPVVGSYDVRLVSARDVASPPLWRTLVARGHEVVVWGVPVTWPPEPVEGVLAAGMLSPTDAAWTWPLELADELRARGLAPDLGVWRTTAELTPARIEEQLRLKEEALVEALARPTWSFAMVVFKELDVLAHRAYDGRTEGAVADLVVRLDAILGRLLEAAGPETDVVLMSDHGFRVYRKVFDLDAWLAQEGFAVRRPDATLPAAVGGPLAEARATERGARLARLDMSRTRAFADVAEGNYAAVRLNVRGREPAGAVDRSERTALLEALEARLAALEFPAGIPLVRRTWRGADLYPGPHQERVVPDLIIELEPTWRAVASGLGPVVFTSPIAFPEHARDGVCVVAGPTIAPSTARERWRLVDVAPLCLHLLGEPVPSGMRGDAHADIERAPRPVVRVPEDRDPSLRTAEEAYAGVPAAGDSAEVRARLRSLGYTE